MAKTKQPDGENRSGLDYYEYKQLQETARLRRRALEANLHEARRKNEPAFKSKMRVVAKIADESPAKGGASEDSRRQHVNAAAAPSAVPAAEAAADALLAQQEPDALDEQPDKGYDENDVEITNPFADALGKIRMLSSRLLKKRDKQEPDAEYDEDEASEGGVPQETIRTKAARLKSAGRPGVTLALSEDDDDADIDRRSRRRAAQAVHAVSGADDGNDDPLGVMRPYSEDERRAYMRPSAEDDDLHRSVTRASKQQRIRDAAPQADATLTTKLLDDLENIPALSRRERKALASAGTLSKAATRKTAASGDEPLAADSPIDEPTQQFKPLRYRAVKSATREVPRESQREAQREVERVPPARIPAPIEDDEDDYLDDEEEDDEDDYTPQPPRRFGRKRRVYRDEEYDSAYGEDDYDDEDDEDYDSDYDEDDEDYDDYDDYDEEEALEDRYQIGFGKRVLAVIKGLLIVVLVFLLIVVALRQLEASGKLSLDFIRNTVGQMLPIEMLLPDPNAGGGAVAGSDEAPLSDDLTTPEPTFEPEDYEGSPLDDYGDSGEMQGMNDYDELEGYSDIGGDDDFDDDDFGDDFEGDFDEEDEGFEAAQAHASFERFAV